MSKDVVELDVWEGHLVLMCKGWYMVDDVTFFDAVRRLWAIRCGLPIESANATMDEYLADGLFKIMLKCNPDRMVYFHEVLHREITKSGYWGGKPEDMTHIQALIWEYRSFLQSLMISDTDEEGNRFQLISLPKERKRLMKRIVNGRGTYDDYKKVVRLDDRVLEKESV